MLGPDGISRLLDEAEPLVPDAAAIIFPHTRLSTSGALAAAAALAVLRSGADEVLTLGVLHGARERDADLVRRARQGEPAALASLRRVHGPGAPLDAGHADEEFSLDGFTALLEAAARRQGRPPPRLLARYPMLTGAQPETLPGMDELFCALERGATLVATADMVHHGTGYGTPEDRRIERNSEAAMTIVRATVEEMLALLAARDFVAHERRCVEVRSDFRDAGPVFAQLAAARGVSRPVLLDMRLVNYADVLRAPEPTWVAAALVKFGAG